MQCARPRATEKNGLEVAGTRGATPIRQGRALERLPRTGDASTESADGPSIQVQMASAFRNDCPTFCLARRRQVSSRTVAWGRHIGVELASIPVYCQTGDLRALINGACQNQEQDRICRSPVEGMGRVNRPAGRKNRLPAPSYLGSERYFPSRVPFHRDCRGPSLYPFPTAGHGGAED
jgi:hypothetical protein